MAYPFPFKIFTSFAVTLYFLKKVAVKRIHLISSVNEYLSLVVIILLLFTCFPRLKASTGLADAAEEVRIGLLVPNQKSLSAIQGAGLAIRIANENGGLKGKLFRLISRTMEGPWGTGSKQAVSLIFEEKVWALLGSHDGRNAHLVEQAATKSTVVFVSAWAGDPTLSQAFVPWFFNCVPNDIQQSEALIEEIYDRRNLSSVAVVYDDDYDSMQALSNFLKKADLENKPEPVQFHYENSPADLNTLSDKIADSGADCLILFCNPLISNKIFLTVRRKDKTLAFFGPQLILNEDILAESELREYNNEIMVPSLEYQVSKYSEFRRRYLETYGIAPGMVAAYAFDGMNALIRAISNSGSREREKIQKALSEINFEGVTGPVKFDEKGNRLSRLSMMNVIDGFPVIPDKQKPVSLNQ